MSRNLFTSFFSRSCTYETYVAFFYVYTLDEWLFCQLTMRNVIHNVAHFPLYMSSWYGMIAPRFTVPPDPVCDCGTETAPVSYSTRVRGEIQPVPETNALPEMCQKRSASVRSVGVIERKPWLPRGVNSVLEFVWTDIK